MDIIILGHAYYLVRFTNLQDRERVLTNGPWTVQGHYLTVSQWSPSFKTSEATVESTLAWICFPDLSMMFYDEDVLSAIASAIGKLVKIDINTRVATRGRLARVCVEIDLTNR